MSAQTPLQQLETICAEIYERWDKDMRSGKLLQALGGGLPKYRADVDAVRAALQRDAVNADMLAALEFLEAGLRTDSRGKTVLSNTVEYHLDGQAMYIAINKARAAIAKARGYEIRVIDQ